MEVELELQNARTTIDRLLCEAWLVERREARWLQLAKRLAIGLVCSALMISARKVAGLF